MRVYENLVIRWVVSYKSVVWC